MTKRKWDQTIPDNRERITVKDVEHIRNGYQTRSIERCDIKRHKPTIDCSSLSNLSLHPLFRNTSPGGNPMSVILSFLKFQETVACKRVCKGFAYHMTKPYAWAHINQRVQIYIEISSLSNELKHKSKLRIQNSVVKLLHLIRDTTNGLLDGQNILGGEMFSIPKRLLCDEGVPYREKNAIRIIECVREIGSYQRFLSTSVVSCCPDLQPYYRFNPDLIRS